MATFPTATEARTSSVWTRVVNQEIAIIELAILDAIDNDVLTVTIDHTTEVVIGGQTITGSIMANNNDISAAYYSVWQGITEDTAALEQMLAVISYFEGLGYSITRLANVVSDVSYLKWQLNW